MIPQRIRERGFRKWYERELIRSHSHLLLLVLCGLAVFGGLEALFASGAREKALVAAALAVAIGVGAWALRRYLFFLMRAEHIANQAVCPQCKAYARWAIEREARSEDPPPKLLVRCHRCQMRWPIDW